jgi:hypothetical protein
MIGGVVFLVGASVAFEVLSIGAAALAALLAFAVLPEVRRPKSRFKEAPPIDPENTWTTLWARIGDVRLSEYVSEWDPKHRREVDDAISRAVESSRSRHTPGSPESGGQAPPDA